jgi:hypothetical protein
LSDLLEPIMLSISAKAAAQQGTRMQSAQVEPQLGLLNFAASRPEPIAI